MLLQVLLRNFYAGKRVLVTGGAGFIGSRLVAELVGLGANVYVVDDLSTGKTQNVQSLLHRITFFREDLRNEAFLKGLLAHEFSLIFHLAAVSSIPRAEREPLLCGEVNVKAFAFLLQQLAVTRRTPTIVFSSTSAVYGEVNKACAEGDPLNPISIYAKSKLDGEMLLKEFSAISNSSAFALRYFNVFADGKDECMIGASASVFSIFRKAFLQKGKISIFGSGKQLRDYVPMSKVVQANLLMPLSGLVGFSVFNVASGQSITLFDLIEKIEKELGLPVPPIEFLPARVGDVETSVADCTKFQKLVEHLGF
jgi:UDP-glucose 4-epimerase